MNPSATPCFVIAEWQICLIFEPRDLWVGIYWENDSYDTTIYLCLIPTLPIRFLKLKDQYKEQR